MTPTQGCAPAIPSAAFHSPQCTSRAGLGFEDCSAKVVNVTDGQFAASHTFAAEHEEIAAKAWNFYAFNVSQEDYQVVINVAGESDSPDECASPETGRLSCQTRAHGTTGSPGLLAAGTKFGYFGAFAKFGQPPGWRYGQWDFRPQWDLYQEQDNDLEIAFDQTMEGYQSGDTPALASAVPNPHCAPAVWTARGALQACGMWASMGMTWPPASTPSPSASTRAP